MLQLQAILDYHKKISKICEMFTENNCGKCPLFGYHCGAIGTGLSKQEVEDVIHIVSEVEIIENAVCKKCGFDYKQHSNYKFCPECGLKREGI